MLVTLKLAPSSATCTGPAPMPHGAVQTMSASDTLSTGTGIPCGPKRTRKTWVRNASFAGSAAKPEPRMVTSVPPVASPSEGVTDATSGHAECTNGNHLPTSEPAVPLLSDTER